MASDSNHASLQAFHERIHSGAGSSADWRQPTRAVKLGNYFIEEHMAGLKDEREDIQKRTFTRWINSHLKKRGKAEVEDLFGDFCNGKSLLALLEILSGVPLNPEKGRMRVHYLNNVNKAVSYLKDKCNIRLVNISSDDVVNGNAKLILGLVWNIIVHWQVNAAMADQPSSSSESVEKMLLAWCRSSTQGYTKVNIQNFTSSWSDGFAFNALIHSHRPDLFDYEELVLMNDVDYALIHAFHIADTNFHIAKLLEPKDMERPDKKSVLLYITCLYNELHQDDQSTNHHSLDNGVTNQMTSLSPPLASSTNRDSSSTTPTTAVLSSSEDNPFETVTQSVSSLSSAGLSPPVRQHMELQTATGSFSTLGDQSHLASTANAASDVISVTTPSCASSLVDLATINSLLESTLTWLHEAKDKFNNMKPVADNVDAVKLQFHEHEKFMLDLTQYQSNVGALLTKGNSLVISGELTNEQEVELRQRLENLNQEWEELRVGAMERQTSLQQSLMDLQMDQLNELSAWLSQMEERIDNFNSKVENFETLDDVRRCFEEHKKLQESLEKQEDKIGSLQNMVVIVEEGVQDPAYQSMEKMLEDLGARWQAVCQWIDEKWRRLNEIDVQWKSYHTEADLFNRWLEDREVLLGRMRLSNLGDAQVLVNQVHNLKDIEGEMASQMVRYNRLDNIGRTLISYLPSFPQTTEKIQTRLKEYNQRWDSLVQQMEHQTREIAECGVNMDEIIAAAGKQKLEMMDQYDSLYANVSSWLDETEQLLRQQDGAATLTLLQDRCEELGSKHRELQSMQELIKHHEKVLGEARVGDYHKICERWPLTTNNLQEVTASVDMEVHSREVMEEMSTIQHALDEYKSWLDSLPSLTEVDETELTSLHEECRVKLTQAKEDNRRVEKLHSMRHGKLVVSDDRVATDINRLYTDWATLIVHIEEKESEMSQKQASALPKFYLDATNALLSWLKDTEDVLSDSVFIADLATMEKNVGLFEELQGAISEHLENLSYVNKTGEDLKKTITSAGAISSLKRQLSSLNSQWKAVTSRVTEKLSQLNQGIERLKLFETQVNSLTRWMSEMELFLQMEQPVVGEKETLQQQINQSDGALADIETLQSVVEEINASGKILVEGSEEAFGAELKKEIEKVNERWTEIRKMSVRQNELLKDALVKSTNLVENIASLNAFLTDFDSALSEKLVFTTKSDLDTSCTKVKDLEERFERNKTQLESVRRLSAELMERSRQDSLPRLYNRLKPMDSKWEHIKNRLAVKLNECSEVSTRYSDFLSLVQSEEMFLSQLQAKLINDDSEAVDAEDMAAEMDEIESLLEARDTQSASTLDELSLWFKQNDILVRETQTIKEQLDSKLTISLTQARERVELLDRASQKSQDTQLSLSQMETWMNEVNSLFRDWNDQDLLAGDLPDDFKTLMEEFKEKDAFLQSIETQIKDFKVLGKQEAAERLQKKLDMIKEHYAIAQTNFLKWQRPIDFDPKLRRTQQQLHEIDDKIYLIEIFSEDPEHVAVKLEHCTRFYATMSEIKTEVEYVIKTGRQLVEKKQVDFPRRVNQTLDALKSLYNRLGSKISQARKDLDKALKISKVIAKHVLRVSELVEGTEARLASDVVQLEEESQWVQATEKEFEKVHPSFAAISTLHDQFQQFAEDNALEEGKENLQSLKDRWQAAIQALAARRRAIVAQRSNADADLEMFVVKSTRLFAHMKSLKEEFENSGNVKKLHEELVNLKEEVTTLNQDAVDIGARGAQYQERVTPVIDNLNTTYEHLANAVQVTTDTIVAVRNEETQQQPPSNVDIDCGNETTNILVRLRTNPDTTDKYERASLFAQCEAMQAQLSEREREEFQVLLVEWNSNRDATIKHWQSYKLHWTAMSMELGKLEGKLDMAQSEPDLLAEIEEEIARRQVEMNKLNELAEDLTEYDTPPIDQHLLQLNQRWVGIRSRVANFKPTNGPQTNGNSTTIELSPPTKQKYEYAVINKNRKNQAQMAVTTEIKLEAQSPAVSVQKGMALNLASPQTSTNNNVLFVASPVVESQTSVLSTPGSADSSRQRYIVETDLDEMVEPVQVESVNASYDDSVDTEERIKEYRQLLSRVGILQQQLRNSGVDIDQYSHENFTSSQDLLASVHTSMEALESDIDKLEAKCCLEVRQDSSPLAQPSVRLQQAWGELNNFYRMLSSNFSDALKLWTDFHSLLKQMSSWLESTEKILKRTRDRTGDLILDQAKNSQKDLEDGLSQHQPVMHNLARTAISLASKLKPSDAERITEKVTQTTNRWKDVSVEIRSRKPSLYLIKLTSTSHWQQAALLTQRLDSMADSGKCLDVMDDLSFWLDETEIIITTSPDYTNELSLRDVLEKVKDRLEEVPHKREALEFVSKSAKDLWNLPELGPDDKLKIGRDMERVSRKWDKVTPAIEDRAKYLEKSIETLEDLLFETGKLNGDLWQAIEDLAPELGADNFNNICETYPRNKSVTIDVLSIWYREVLLLYKRLNTPLPENLEARYRLLNMRWTAVKERTLLNKAKSDSSIEETLATGSGDASNAASAEDIFMEPRESVFINDHLRVEKGQTASVSTEDGEVGPPPPPRVESLVQPTKARMELSQSSPSPQASADREVTLNLLRSRLAVLNRTVSNRRVDVLDQEQIKESEIKVGKLSTAVKEILLQLSMFPEDENQVSGLRSECEDCHTRSVDRSKELRQLLIDSHQYGDHMAKVDRWLCDLESKIASRKQEAVGDAVDVVDSQMQQHVALEKEVQSWKDNYDLLNRMTDNLLTKYPQEDLSNVKLNSQMFSDRYSNVQSFISEYGQALSTHKQLLDNYEGAIQSFLLWLAEQDAAADVLLEEVKAEDPVRSSTLNLRSKDLQSQIESHQRQHDMLRAAGRKMSNDSANDKEAIKKRLDEMNERWSQLRAKTVQIRCRLESSMDQWSELITRCLQLIEYLNSRENELIAARPVAGNLPGVKRQQAQHQTWKMKLESKTSEFEQTISTGRFYLEKEGADRRLSSASCDSRVMDELAVDSSDAKTVIKSIRRHIRLLNQKWLELHNKSERWQNQLTAGEKNLESLNNLLNMSVRHLNEIDEGMQTWKSVHDYPVSDLTRQLSLARSLRRKNEEVGEELTQAKTLCRNHDSSVDTETKQSILRISERQQRMEKQLSERVSQLVSLNRSLVPEVNELLGDSVNRPYERATTAAGVPYYINHDKKTTQWDHPRMVSLLSQLPKFNTTKFSAYRTAQKLRNMQNALSLSAIRLKDVIKSCQENRVLTSHGEELIDINVVISCLRDLFERLADERHATELNVPLSIDLTLNWLLNVYDLGRVGRMRTLSFQVGLVIMSRGAVEDKFNYLLSCLADQSGCIDERKLTLLLSDCIQIPRQLGEVSSFGGANVEPSVHSCLEQAKSTTSVNSRQFMDWLALEPQSMVWLPVFHRLATSESCKHQAKCSLCKANPITGLRYRCLRCFNFNLCQKCFFTGKKGKSHKLSHPMKEYYCSSTSNDDMKDLSSPMKKKYSSGRYIKKHNPKGYLPLAKHTDGESTLSRDSPTKVNRTPVSSPPSIHIQYEMNSSVSSHDGMQSKDTVNMPQVESDIHQDIGRYANTLGRLENQNTNNANGNDMRGSSLRRNSTERSYASTLPSSSKVKPQVDNDEHQIIERYCTSLTSPAQKTNGHLETSNQKLDVSVDSPLKSPMQIVMSLEDNQKTELEAMIKDLEDENRNLQTEYQRLQAERDQPVPQITATGDREAEMLAEAKLLRQHKGRLEGRMKILEEHNKQLEAQLRRLRHLLEQPSDAGLHEGIQPPIAHTSTSSSPLRVKKLPPTYMRQSSDQQELPVTNMAGTQRTPKLHGSIGELFQTAGQVGKAVGQFVSAVSDQSQTS